MKLYPVETEVLDVALKFGSERHIRDACARSHGKWDYDATELLLRDGTYRLWTIIEDDTVLKASVVTSIEEYPSGRLVLNVVMAAGDNHDRWIGLIEQLEGYGRSMGCRSMQAWGRKGWAKRLKAQGYAVDSVLYEKEL